MQGWLAAAEISSGPVFRSVALGGRIGTAALSPYAASLVIKQRIRICGGPAYSGENCGTPDQPKPCPPLPRHPLSYYPANK